MRWLLGCVIAAACGSGDTAALEERIAKLEAEVHKLGIERTHDSVFFDELARSDGFNGPRVGAWAVFWCPVGGDDVQQHCTPEIRHDTTSITERGHIARTGAIRQAATNAVLRAAEGCAREAESARTADMGPRAVPCFKTRLVFCRVKGVPGSLEHESYPLCYATRPRCEAGAKGPDERCVAYFDGKPAR